MKDKKYDVIIIGGGPAGSTAATLLARGGLKCIVFEKENFPRPHVGESLLPFCYDLLKELGVLELVQANSVNKPGARFLDSKGKQYSNYCFANHIKGPSAISSHVNRAKFDKILLDHSRQEGAEVKEGTKVKSVDINESEVTVSIEQNGTKDTYKGAFLIDASGQHSFMANRMKEKKKIENLDRTAFSAHWEGGNLIDGLEEGIQQIVYVGGEKQGWIWCIPLPDDRLSVGVVLNSGYVKSKKIELANSDNWKKELYTSEMHNLPYIQKILANAQLASPVNISGNYSYKVDKKYGERFALVGDSGTFIDPIFATGVFLAMKSSFLISKSIIENIKTNSIHEGLEKAYTSINGAYALLERLIKQYYNPKAINFHEINDHYEKTDSAIGLMHHILAGDFFDKYEQYDAFLTKLENEKTFARYKNLVYNRKELDELSCKEISLEMS